MKPGSIDHFINYVKTSSFLLGQLLNFKKEEGARDKDTKSTRQSDAIIVRGRFSSIRPNKGEGAGEKGTRGGEKSRRRQKLDIHR